MKTISSHETLKLEPSLETLHTESYEWLNTMLLWEEESKFYLNFLNKKLFEYISPEDKLFIHEMMDEIIGSKVESFKNQLNLHERDLDQLIKRNKDDSDFRYKHSLLVHRFIEFETHLKLFKKSILQLAKLVNQNFFNANETLNTIHERRAVRKYKDEPVEKNHIEQIIQAGRMAPSAMNKQPLKFYVVINKEKIRLLSDEIRKVAENILHLDMKTFHKAQDPVFHNAPVVIFITAPEKDEWGPIDAGMCAQNMMLAAKSLGYDTCPVGFAKAIERSLAYYDMHILSSEKIQLAIVIGKGNEKPEIHERKTDNLIYLR